MALNFPNNPELNQTFVNNGVTWQWNGTVWNLKPEVIEIPEIPEIPDFDTDVNQPLYFVSVDGEDSQLRLGQSWQTSWKTIRYALSRITGPAVIKVGSGIFSEQLPLVIPEGGTGENSSSTRLGLKGINGKVIIY